MTINLFRCFIMYIVVIVAVRLMGKRQIGELQPSELVITILISELASMPIQDIHLPLLSGILPIMALVGFELLISLLTLKSVKLRAFLYGHPVILIYNGEFRQQAMTEARVTVDDIMEVMRNNGISSIEDVDYAILETNGQLSVIEKQQVYPMSLRDASAASGQSDGLPHLIILDGKVIKDNLKECYLTEKWLKNELLRRNLNSPGQVFLMTVDDRQKIYLVAKS